MNKEFCFLISRFIGSKVRLVHGCMGGDNILINTTL